MYHSLSFPIFSIFTKLKKDNHLEPEAFLRLEGFPGWMGVGLGPHSTTGNTVLE